MKTLERYIVGIFLRAFLGALVVFSLCAVTLDFFARVGQFSEAAEITQGTFAEGYGGLRIAFVFYLAYLPLLLKQVLPFLTVSAGLITLSQLLRRNEVMPVLSAGVSARRLLLPLFLCGFVVALAQVAFQELAIPSLNNRHVALMRLFRKGDDVLHDLPHLRDGEGTVTRVGGYHFTQARLTGVVIQRPWTEAGFERWTAPELVPSDDGEAWVAPRGVSIHPAGGVGAPVQMPAGSRVEFGFTAEEIERLVAKEGTQEASSRDLAALVRRFPDRRSLRVSLHQQIARPFTSFVLLLVGLPALIATGRSLFWGGALAFLLSVVYFFSDVFLTSLGDRGDVPPLLAAYLPLAFFGALGAAALATIRT